MAIETAIEWADDTANFWEGCTQISPACDFCYAKKRAEHYRSVEWNGPPRKVKAGVATLRASNRRAMREGRPRLVFINSLSDAMDKLANPDWRRELYDECRDASHTVPLILTKRIGNAVEMSVAAGGWPPNAALGSTMINQEEIDRDLDKLRGAANVLGVRWTYLSVEPMLGPITLPSHVRDWLTAVIVGGESGGPSARPMHPDWVRSLRDQCAELCVNFFFKQWGEWAPGECVNAEPEKTRWVKGATYGPWDGGDDWAFSDENLGDVDAHIDDEPDLFRVGKKAAGRLLDGRTHDDFLPVERAKAAA